MLGFGPYARGALADNFAGTVFVPQPTSVSQALLAGKTPVIGSNLFALAAANYGDFSAFWLLLQANNLSDPMLSGVNNLIVPPYSPALTGGVPPQQ